MGLSNAGSSGVVEIDDVGVADVWDRLKADPASLIVDVRTQAEWAFVGLPDLASIGKQPIFREWQTFPDSRVDPQFADRLSAALSEAGAASDTEIFFICRSGGRSKAAATAMASRGFSRCRNVADGFEGSLDQHRQRGRTGGWKAAGLPWSQG